MLGRSGVESRREDRPVFRKPPPKRGHRRGVLSMAVLLSDMLGNLEGAVEEFRHVDSAIEQDVTRRCKFLLDYLRLGPGGSWLSSSNSVLRCAILV